MGFFDGFRKDGRNSYYGSLEHAVFYDVTHTYVILFCTVITTASIIIILGTRGRERWTTFLRILFTLHTGIFLLLTLFGQCWQQASIRTRCLYSMTTVLEAEIDVMVGLESFNISLKGQVLNNSKIGDINYNEEFHFHHLADMRHDFSEARSRGLPWPILYIAEYFTVDSEGLRWHRSIREAGHFVHILLWAAFATWLLANVLICFVVYYGTLYTIITGLLMLTASVLYDALQPKTELSIHFDNRFMSLQFGWCFWLCAVSGVLTLSWGLASLALYKLHPIKAQMIFLLDKPHLLEGDDKSTASPLKLHERKSLFANDHSLNAFQNPAFTIQETSSGISMTPTGGSLTSLYERRPSYTIAVPSGHVIDIETAIVATPLRRKISVGSMHRVRADQIFATTSATATASDCDSRSCDSVSQCSSKGSIS